MLRPLQSVALASALGGCSLIYNPNNLPDPAAPADAMADAIVVVDADPAFLALTSASPSQIYEGQGDGGSRAAMIVVEGTQMVPGARITLTRHSDGTPFLGAVLDDANTVVSDDGKEIAVPAKFTVDQALHMGSSVDLDVTVTQQAGGASIAKTLPMALSEVGLEELRDTPTLDVLQAGNKIASGTYLVSQVNITGSTGGLGLIPADNAKPLIIRSISSVSIAGAISVDANTVTPGPGGRNGGGGGGQVTLGSSNGTAGGGDGGGQPNGGGGGFGDPGMSGAGAGGGTSGEPELLTLGQSGTKDTGSGGAGGGGSTLGGGGGGGAGGGTIEVSGGGTVMLADVHAIGGKGAATGQGNGGGGSGGAVLLRSGAGLTVGAVTVTGGAKGSSGSGTAAGDGGAGRIRVDTPDGSTLGYQGPMFALQPIVDSTTLITRKARPSIAIRGNPTATYHYYFSNSDASAFSALGTGTIGGNGQATISVGADLFHGLNHFCVLPNGAQTDSPPEAKNCVDLVYLYQQP